jgi:Bacterial PH domain
MTRAYSFAMLPPEIAQIERPHPNLLKCYVLRSILSGPFAIITLPLFLCRYYTLRYAFDEEGIHAKWGLFFRHEVNLAYARIQDIHLASGILQRWLGLADVQIQTASGSTGPELIIEGCKEFSQIRDFLYQRMRGGRQSTGSSPAPAAAAVASNPEMVQYLQAIAGELRATRIAVEKLTQPR